MKIEMNSGNFNFTVRGELSPEKQAALLIKGMKYELERGVLSDVYKQLAGVVGKRGKKVLPDGFERDSIGYNDANRDAFYTNLVDSLAKLGTFEVSIGEYVKGEGGESRKRATGIYEKSLAKGQATLDQLAAMCGYDGDTEDESEFIAAIHEWLQDATK